MRQKKISLKKILNRTLNLSERIEIPPRKKKQIIQYLSGQPNKLIIYSTVYGFELTKYIPGISLPKVKTLNKPNTTDKRLEENSILYISNHISNTDGLIILPEIVKSKLPIPIYATGENLYNNKILNYLMQKTGGFKVPRSVDREKLVLLRTYIQSLVEDNTPLFIFPEGTRSRTGKLNPLKVGILNMLTKQKPPEKILLFPIGISYTHTKEEKNIIQNPLQSAENSNLFSQLRKKQPTAYIKFGEPQQLSNYIKENKEINLDSLHTYLHETIPTLPNKIPYYILNQTSKEIKYDEFKQKIMNIYNKNKFDIELTEEDINYAIKHLEKKHEIKTIPHKNTIEISEQKNIIKYYSNQIEENIKKQ